MLGDVAPAASDLNATEHSHEQTRPFVLCSAALIYPRDGSHLSPRSAIGSPIDSGLSPTSSSITQAVTTIPSNSSKLIVTVQVSRRSAFYFNSVVSSGVRSYIQKTFLSTQYPPTASRLASGRYCLLAGRCNAV